MEKLISPAMPQEGTVFYEGPPVYDQGFRLFSYNRAARLSEWHRYNDLTKETTIRICQDVEPILDNNQALSNHDDGWNEDKTMRRVASIPTAVLTKFREKGIDLLNPEKDPKAFKRIMNDSDYRKLRTAHWNL